MVQSITFAANSFTLGTGTSRVILGANSGGLTIKDPSSNTLALVPGVPVGSGGGSGGATVYSTAADLPLSGLTAGEFALVGNNSVNTNALYVTNGGGWYKISIVNLTPSVSLSETTVTFSTANANTDIAVTINEPEGTPVTVTVSNTGIANGTVANGTFHSSNNTFIIKGGSVSTSGMTFTISASDGINVGTASITFNIEIVDWTQSAEDMTIWSFMDGEANHPNLRYGRMDPSGTHIVITGAGSSSNHNNYAYYFDNNNNVHSNYSFAHANTQSGEKGGQGQFSSGNYKIDTRAADFDADGRTFVIGAASRDSSGGGVHVFERATSNNWWSYLTSIYRSNPKTQGQLKYYPTVEAANSTVGSSIGTGFSSKLGQSVALSGDSKWLIVGAPWHGTGLAGNVWAYYRSAVGNKFTFHHELQVQTYDNIGGTATDATSYLSGSSGAQEYCGMAVDTSYHGDWAVIGVPSYHTDDDYPAAYIAFRNGSLTKWFKHQTLGPHLFGLAINDGIQNYARTTSEHKQKNNSQFGAFVCINSSSNSQIDATTIAISDPYGKYANGSSVYTGTVHIYGREPSGNTWTLQQTVWNQRLKTYANGNIISGSTQPLEGFGRQLDLSADGSRLFISVNADQNDGDQSGKGCMHVFDRDSSNNWTFTSNVAFANAATGNEWASSISANEDGNRALMVAWSPHYAVVDAS